MANTGQYDSQTNIETEDYEREIFVRPEAAVIYGGSVVNSVNGQVGDVILTTSDLENTSDYQTGAQVQNAIAGKQDKLTAGSGLNLDGTILSVDTNIIATVQDVTDEATIRENSDANLQGQIDALTVSSDVIDVLGTYQDLQNYDTSHVKANDIIKVLQDSTHDNSMSYYRWEITDHVGSWVYVGSEGPYYTKSEADALLDGKQNVLTAGDNISITNDTISAVDTTYTAGNGLDLTGTEFSVDSTVVALQSDLPTVNDATLTIQKNSTDVGTFTANASSNSTINITVPTATSQLVNDSGYTTNTGTITSVKMNGSTVATSGEANLGTVITDVSEKQDIADNSLATSNKTVPGAINEVNSIAKGANQALSYGNYSTMITAFNSLASNVYNVGQNVMIITLQVPDLWISGIESTSQTYTYTTDEAFTTELNTNGYVQVGYYKLSALETQKVNLTNYVTFDDYATAATTGVVKTSAQYGISTSSYTKNLTGAVRTYAQYQNGNDVTIICKGTLENVITGKNLETSNNKVTSISSSSTNTEYPSAKAVYDYIQSLNGDEVNY